ncbi:MAG: acyl-CoA thioesterase [Bacteroidales bacterium]|jgi:acyl-CoA thioester hydrolase|nr:acyl-CoA thioesterase [Bacteroidales bacterium]
MLKSEHFLDVRYYETDQMGIVHHSNYIRYFECGRVAMLRDLGFPVEKIEETGVMLPVVSVECRYKVPAKLGETLKIVSMIDEVPRARLVIKTEIFNPAGQLVCEGGVVLGFINSQTRRPVRCPDDLVKIFEENLN